MSELHSRAFVALTLAGLIAAAVIWHYEFWILLLAQTALFFDISWTLYEIPSCRYLLSGVWITVMFSINQLYSSYLIQPFRVLVIIAVTQISDVLQYLGGRWLGHHHVGWISPKKTYEGYGVAMLGLLGLSYLAKPTWCYQTCRSDFLILGLLGFLGGIVNSWIKRYLQIKNWSPLLGSHGGFIDRMDSVVLPALMLYINESS